MAPVTIERFPGLNLAADVAELGFNGAASLENVDPRSSGIPQRRSGASVFNAIAPTNGGYVAPFVGAATSAQTSLGPRSPGAVTSGALGGGTTWTTASNAAASDNVYTTAALSSSSSKNLRADNFGFSIPAGATINGIVVEIERKQSGTVATDFSVKLLKAGVVGGTDKAAVGPYPAADAYAVYGSSSDLWGQTWTAEDINLSEFGVDLIAITFPLGVSTVSVDHVRITVTYTAAIPATKSVYGVYVNSSGLSVIDRMDAEHGNIEGSSAAFSSAGSGGRSCRFSQLGTTTTTYVFCSSGLENDGPPMRYDGSSFTNTAYVGQDPNGACLAVTPWDNRLVSAGGSSSTWASKVAFSDEGAPLTFATANDLELHPGDGEYIHDLVTWNNQVFAFKQTKFFVFWGVSVDSTGGPVFEYRTVPGEGVADTSLATLAAAGTDGVYFVNQSGVWRTTGGQAVLVSQDIDPLFSGDGSDNPYFDATRRAPSGLFYARGRLYLTFDGLVDTFVYDIANRWWSVYDLPSGAVYGVAEDPASSTNRVILAIDSPDLYSMDATLTQDGAADEVQSVVATGGTAGTFTLVYDGQTTANINWDDTAAEVQAALEALSNIAVGDVYCYGGPLPTAKIYIKFEGTLAATNLSDLTIGTEAITNGDALQVRERNGAAATPISCEWTSGATDLGVDGRKAIKDLVVTATDGTLGVAVSTELAAFPAATSKTFTNTESLRYRSAATNRRGRLVAVELSNSTASEAASGFNVHRLTLQLMAPSSAPAHGSDT